MNKCLNECLNEFVSVSEGGSEPGTYRSYGAGTLFETMSERLEKLGIELATPGLVDMCLIHCTKAFPISV